MLRGENNYKPEKKPTIFFDGICNLCNGFVRFIIRQDKEGIFRFGLLQSENTRELLKSFGQLTTHHTTVVLLDDNLIYTESDAILRILKGLKNYCLFYYCLILIPKLIRDAGYELISHYRYRIFGGRKNCMLPSSNIKDRFI